MDLNRSKSQVYIGPLDQKFLSFRLLSQMPIIHLHTRRIQGYRLLLLD